MLNHLIHIQTLDLTFNRIKERDSIEKQIKGLFQEELLDEVSKIFDELCPADCYVQLDQLKIDLGEMSTLSIDQKIKDIFLKQLRIELSKVLSPQELSPSYNHQNQESLSSFWKKESDLVTHKNIKIYSEDALLFYLKNGFFPISCKVKEQGGIKILVDEILPNPTSSFSLQLKKILIEQEYARVRFFYALSKLNQENLLSLIGLDEQEKNILLKSISLILRKFKRTISNPIMNQSYLTSRLKSLFLEYFLSSPSNNASRSNSLKLISTLANLLHCSVEEIISVFVEEEMMVNQIGEIKKVYQFFQREIKKESSKDQFFAKNINSFSEEIQKLNDETILDIQTKWDAEIQSENKFNDEIDEKEYKENIAEEIPIVESGSFYQNQTYQNDQEGLDITINLQNKSHSIFLKNDETIRKGFEIGNYIYLKNAGLILLHPFLPRFFQEFSLLDEQSQFANEGAKEKAIHLLHYLAYGETKANESDFVLNKILCGLPISFPVSGEFEISDEEQAEAELLLSTVIEHWSALKGTSPDGLRTSFLQREGKIIFEENLIRLIVKQQTLDILLDRIPWTISYIKLSWMDNTMTTQWN